MKYNIHFLPAKYGDCIWIEYGTGNKSHHILIDGGTGGTRKEIKKLLENIPEDERHFELMVVTHIDKDHIEGMLSLLEESELGFTVDDFWFNGWQHLPEDGDETFGAVQGERLTAAIKKHQLNWNKLFDNNAVVIPQSGELPEINLPGGMKITLLSPLVENLVNLRPAWEKEVRKAGLEPGYGAEEIVETPDDEESFGALPNVDNLNDELFHEDTAAANGSSISFLGTYQGKTVFFGGDSFPSVVLNSLNKIYDGNAPVELVKLSHHASAHNTSPELIEKFNCNKYIISTNGSIFHHPAQVTIARVIKRGSKNPELYFNYKSDDNKVWDSPTLKTKHKYKTFYPADGGEGISISII